MTYLALNKTTGDLIINPEGGVERVSEGRFVVQQVKSRLQTFLGEWLPDKSIGFVNRYDYSKQYDLFDLEARATEIIISTQGVRSITKMLLTFNKRALTLAFEAETDYGDIELTIPWG